MSPDLLHDNGIRSEKRDEIKDRFVILKDGQEISVKRASERDDTREESYDNLNFRNSHLSKEHAKFRLLNGRLWVRDNGSTFGTIINGSRIVPHKWFPLNEGDIIGFIIAIPSMAITKVVRRFENQDKILLSEFGEPSIGFSLQFELSENKIHFFPAPDATESVDDVQETPFIVERESSEPEVTNTFEEKYSCQDMFSDEEISRDVESVATLHRDSENEDFDDQSTINSTTDALLALSKVGELLRDAPPLDTSETNVGNTDSQRSWKSYDRNYSKGFSDYGSVSDTISDSEETPESEQGEVSDSENLSMVSSHREDDSDICRPCLMTIDTHETSSSSLPEYKPSDYDQICGSKFEQNLQHVNRKRCYDDLLVSDAIADADIDTSHEPETKKRKSLSAPSFSEACRSLLKEATRGAFYVAATILAMGVYGSSLQEKQQ
ncbi:Piso0_002184 [Millerozyma farinosa CBS 7064]|uniref:Piso0_002184 protein n=1 Tax=Pichia sorbitophila (strain ATCC MYA-4447 / BCRC 22081 / CBS 7064 / NBRC 10061 / NRRL Y-12695) TaxID=559304 RepID=G8YBX6_PICSO|nr:Piso0_002184 [Millerozyma farinosa CBS 7064]